MGCSTLVRAIANSDAARLAARCFAVEARRSLSARSGSWDSSRDIDVSLPRWAAGRAARNSPTRAVTTCVEFRKSGAKCGAAQFPSDSPSDAHWGLPGKERHLDNSSVSGLAWQRIKFHSWRRAPGGRSQPGYEPGDGANTARPNQTSLWRTPSLPHNVINP